MPHSTDPTFPLYPIFAFIGFVISVIPLPWHIQAWNSGTCAYMIWTATNCLMGFVNALLWKGNVINVAPIWCDISTKLLIGCSVGIPASILCITRRLYCLLSVKNAAITIEDKRRMVLIDLCIALGIPVLIMILHVIVQPHRFDIFEDIGCLPVIYNTIPAYFLYNMWPILLGVISFCYSALTLRAFWIRRLHFNQLVTSNSSMSISRYLRLIMFATLDMMSNVPLSAYSLYQTCHGVRLAPWISWEDTHFDFGRVGLFPSIIWRSKRSLQISMELTRWLPVVCAIFFFAMFGFATEARKHYKLAFWTVAKIFGFKRTPAFNRSKKATVPSWIKPLKTGKDKATELTSVSSVAPPSYTQHAAVSPLERNESKKSRSMSVASSDGTYLAAHDDIEKSAGLSPSSTSVYSLTNEYTRPPPAHVPSDIPSSELDIPYTPSSASSRLTFVGTLNIAEHEASLTLEPPKEPKTKTSSRSLRTLGSEHRIYISTDQPVIRAPSPPPFSNVRTIAPYHRPISPPNAYPVAQPHPNSQGLTEAIQVAVRTTESRFAESV